MPRRPVVAGKEMVRALERAGFFFDRQRGSHVTMRHQETGRSVTVPVHAGEALTPKILSSVLEQAGLTVDELRRLLK